MLAQDPEDCLSLVILLDQFARNIYRNATAKTVYADLDPKTLQLAKIYTQEKHYLTDSTFTARPFAVSMWFLLPLMHSENIADHRTLEKELSTLLSNATDQMDQKMLRIMTDVGKQHS